MYWCKPKPLFTISISLLLLAACKPYVKDGGPRYFDLKKYFEAEATRLNTLHPTITKTVTYNNEAEKKTVAIKNWKQELDLFEGSDINKPSWGGSYRVSTKGDSVITYTAIDDKLRTRSIVIKQKDHKPTHIDISNFSENLLYKTVEHLVYVPGSDYRIEKHQSVRILGDNNYQIWGTFR